MQKKIDNFFDIHDASSYNNDSDVYNDYVDDDILAWKYTKERRSLWFEKIVAKDSFLIVWEAAFFPTYYPANIVPAE